MDHQVGPEEKPAKCRPSGRGECCRSGRANWPAPGGVGGRQALLLGVVLTSTTAADWIIPRADKPVSIVRAASRSTGRPRQPCAG